MSKYDKAAPAKGTSRAGAKTSQKKSGGGTLVGVFIGLVIGIVIAFGVVFFLNKSPMPFQSKGETAKAASEAPVPNGATVPAPLPGKPGDKVNDKQRFQFYGILEGKQSATPGTGTPDGAPTASASPAVPTAPAASELKVPASEVLYLQAGSFQKPADADNLKAKLALSGLDASVQEVNIPDKGTMHRVRIGPFSSTAELNRVRTQLSQAGVQAAVVKP